MLLFIFNLLHCASTFRLVESIAFHLPTGAQFKSLDPLGFYRVFNAPHTPSVTRLNPFCGSFSQLYNKFPPCVALYFVCLTLNATAVDIFSLGLFYFLCPCTAGEARRGVRGGRAASRLAPWGAAPLHHPILHGKP